jgi:uncharacterized membrane protein
MSEGWGADMRFLFWIITSLLLALTTHLTYVLFMPRSQFNKSLEVALDAQKENNFGILSPAAQTRLMPFASAFDLVGICRFDTSGGTVNFSVEVPRGYWVFAVYTMSGQQVYALNDKQADALSFKVSLSKTASLIEQVTDSGGSDEPAVTDFGWQVKLTEPKGVAFLWMPHGDSLRRSEAERVLSKSSCSTG